MKKLLAITVLSVILIGSIQAFGQEEPDETFVFWILYPDKKVKTTVETFYIEINVPSATQPIIINQHEFETIEEFIHRAEIIVQDLMVPPPEPMTEQEIIDEKVKTQAEEARKEVEDKRAERFEEAIRCLQDGTQKPLFGSFGNAMFQTEMELVVLAKMEYFRHLPDDNKVRELLLKTEACNKFKASYLNQYKEYIGKYEGQKSAEQKELELRGMVEFDSPRTNPVTQRDLDKEAQIAWDLKRPYNNPYIIKEEVEEREIVYKLSQFNPVTQKVDIFPIRDLAEYYLQEIFTLENAERQLCEDAYTQTHNGTTSMHWWPIMLIDGVCDEHVPELEEIRGDYVREQWSGQTKANCPDCKQFKE